MVCCQEWYPVVRAFPFEVLQDVQSGWWLTFCSNTGNSSVNEERAGEKEREKAIEEWIGEEKEKEKKSTIEKIRNLPPPPVHIPFQGLYAPHMARSIGPAVGLADPYTLFSLFFSENELEILAKNTNLYALVHDAGIRSNSHPFVRKWHPTSPQELLVFLAIVIHMGLWKGDSLKEFWRRLRAQR